MDLGQIEDVVIDRAAENRFRFAELAEVGCHEDEIVEDHHSVDAESESSSRATRKMLISRLSPLS